MSAGEKRAIAAAKKAAAAYGVSGWDDARVYYSDSISHYVVFEFSPRDFGTDYVLRVHKDGTIMEAHPGK